MSMVETGDFPIVLVALNSFSNLTRGAKKWNCFNGNGLIMGLLTYNREGLSTALSQDVGECECAV